MGRQGIKGGKASSCLNYVVYGHPLVILLHLCIPLGHISMRCSPWAFSCSVIALNGDLGDGLTTDVRGGENRGATGHKPTNLIFHA